jgi:N-succinyldiaminopimelate aminotransferase
MSPVVQAASIAAWNDEAHVVANRALYRAKFAQVRRCWPTCWTCACPTPASTCGPACRGGGDDIAFARGLLAQYNVTVLPGSLLARTAQGHNPGAGRIRMALVAGVDECLEAAHRIVAYTESLMSTDDLQTHHRPAWEGRAEPVTPTNAARPRCARRSTT